MAFVMNDDNSITLTGATKDNPAMNALASRLLGNTSATPPPATGMPPPPVEDMQEHIMPIEQTPAAGGLLTTPSTLAQTTTVLKPMTQTFTPAAPPPPPPTQVARTLTAKETVAGQLNELLAAGSPVMRSAENRAKEQANARGLINSSMAVGAAQRAVIDAATPIATTDAQLNAQAGQSAQDANQNIALTGFQAGNQRVLSAQEAGQQSGLTTQQGLINSQLNREQFGYTTAANEQNIAGNTALANINNAAALNRQNVSDAAAADRITKTAAAELANQTALKNFISDPTSDAGRTLQAQIDQAAADLKNAPNAAVNNYFTISADLMARANQQMSDTALIADGIFDPAAKQQRRKEIVDTLVANLNAQRAGVTAYYTGVTLPEWTAANVGGLLSNAGGGTAATGGGTAAAGSDGRPLTDPKSLVPSGAVNQAGDPVNAAGVSIRSLREELERASDGQTDRNGTPRPAPGYVLNSDNQWVLLDDDGNEHRWSGYES